MNHRVRLCHCRHRSLKDSVSAESTVCHVSSSFVERSTIRFIHRRSWRLNDQMWAISQSVRCTKSELTIKLRLLNNVCYKFRITCIQFSDSALERIFSALKSLNRVYNYGLFKWIWASPPLNQSWANFDLIHCVKKTSSNIEIIHWLIEIFNLLKLFKVLLFPQRKTVENVKWIVYKNRLDIIFVRVCVCGCCSVAVQSSRSTIHVNGMLFLE